MQLVVISPPGPATPRETQLVGAMLDRGLVRYHLRKPASGQEEVRQYLSELTADHRRRVVLHQHHELAAPLGLLGVHYPERHRPPAPLPPLSSPPLTQSTSFHELHQLSQDWGALDFAFLSPIFDSISKEGYNAAPFDRRELRQTLTATAVPTVIALGGITSDRVAECAALRFKGVAVIGAVWSASDPLAAYVELQKACIDVL